MDKEKEHKLDITPPAGTLASDEIEITTASRPGRFNINIYDRSQAKGTRPGPQRNNEYGFDPMTLPGDTLIKITKNNNQIGEVKAGQIGSQQELTEYLQYLDKNPGTDFTVYRVKTVLEANLGIVGNILGDMLGAGLSPFQVLPFIPKAGGIAFP